MKNNKYLILRRVVQLMILLLFMSGAYRFSEWLMGNYSSAYVVKTFYLSDPYTILQMIATGIWPSFELLIGAGIVTLFYAILGGRMFCSWICPLNIVTDFASFLRKKIRIQPLLKISNKQKVRKLKYYVFSLGLLLSFIFGISAFEIINPISMLHRSLIFGLGFGLNIVFIVFLVDLFILPHAWCGHICPVGAYYSIIGKLSFLKVFHNKEQCTLCMKCKQVCPEIQVLDIIGQETGKIKSSSCTNCARCIDVCDDNALNFKLLNHKKYKKNDL